MRFTVRNTARVLGCVLMIAVVVGCGGRRVRPEGWLGGGPRWFETELLTGFDEEGSRVATLAVSVPYRNLVFFADEDEFVSRFRIRVVQRLGDQSLNSREWSAEARANDYAATRSTTLARRTIRIDLPATEVDATTLAVSVAVEGSRRRATNVLAVRPDRIDAGGVALGELALYRRRDPRGAALPTTLDIGSGLVPDPELFAAARRVSFDRATGEPWLLVRIFDLVRDDAERTHRLSLRVSSEGRENWTTSFTLERQGVESSMLLQIPASALRFGENTLAVTLDGGAQRELELTDLGLDLRDDDSWRANLRQIEILAQTTELEQLREAERDDRETAWQAFWDRRDSDADEAGNERMLEHYRRVAHSRRRFGEPGIDGALTDRGRVYVLRGEPTRIESLPPRFGDATDWELWHYLDLGIVYYFRAVQGGSYRMAWSERI